ncbi:MATE family efflux transporter [Noviherbaspirillum sp. Root189]|uniref:MATE family efflux transporter n=1 Tax=Noviherbaspirillum sp. Root189 TaxID=1736487 RepID=UPI00070DBE26|nr:MATE family efflux transporter [Noviherbaspirillum sp. Root189]KRB84824.1 MATE family efflux transporter [Noviherbaspirillum sp. Root189]
MNETPSLDPRTRRLLEAPILPTLLRLGAPNVLVMVAQASVGLIETYFVGKLGTQALAGMALVFPVVMLMQMMSAGAIGGGIASAIARALGAKRRDDANDLVLHSLLLAVLFGLAFMLIVLPGGYWLYGKMGGSGEALDAALKYSNWVFAGAVIVWIFNSLAAVIRGTGNMAVPAIVTCAGLVILVPLSPLLIFGWGPVQGMGIAGGAAALLSYYLVGSFALAWYLWSPHSLLRPSFEAVRFRWTLFKDILRVGLAGAISTVATNLAIGITTMLVGGFGTAAIAGFGTASRLEYLLVPLVFGFGGPLVAIVGTCIGAGKRERALHATWIGAGMAAVITEAIGLLAATFPHAWLTLFDSDPAMLDAGTQYLQAVGPVYGLFGLGLTLYFASQGAGRLKWPVAGNAARLAVAAIGGWLALRYGGTLMHIFAMQAVALVIYGLINAWSIAGGAWFGPIGWPSSTSTLMKRMQQS